MISQAARRYGCLEDKLSHLDETTPSFFERFDARSVDDDVRAETIRIDESAVLLRERAQRRRVQDQNVGVVVNRIVRRAQDDRLPKIPFQLPQPTVSVGVTAKRMFVPRWRAHEYLPFAHERTVRQHPMLLAPGQRFARAQRVGIDQDDAPIEWDTSGVESRRLQRFTAQ